MKLLRILSFVAILGLAFTSCSKDDSNDQPTPAKKQLVKISSTTTSVGSSRIDTETFDLNYDSNGLFSGWVSTLKESSEPATTETYKIKYGDNGKMSQITQLADANTIKSQVDITYASANKRTFVETWFYEGSSSHKVKTEQELNSEGKPIKEHAYIFEDGQWVNYYNSGDNTLEWVNGNLVKQTVTNKDGGISEVITYQYDSKSNPFSLNRDAICVANAETLESLSFFFGLLNPSKNAVTARKCEYEPNNSKYNWASTIKHTYSVDGYLIKSEANSIDEGRESNTTIEYSYK